MDRDLLISREIIAFLGIIMLSVYILMAFISPVFKEIAVRFVSILAAPATHLMTIYSLGPIYLNWITSEYFREEIHPEIKEAAKNGFTGIWVAGDWVRATYGRYYDSPNPLAFVVKLVLSALLFIYGVVLVTKAFKEEKIVMLIGRVREISYIAIMITPLVYGAVPVDWITLTAMLVFYPVFYALVELILFAVPIPGTVAFGSEKDI